jgi:hypothetical protein
VTTDPPPGSPAYQPRPGPYIDRASLALRHAEHWALSAETARRAAGTMERTTTQTPEARDSTERVTAVLIATAHADAALATAWAAIAALQ